MIISYVKPFFIEGRDIRPKDCCPSETNFQILPHFYLSYIIIRKSNSSDVIHLLLLNVLVHLSRLCKNLKLIAPTNISYKFIDFVTRLLSFILSLFSIK